MDPAEAIYKQAVLLQQPMRAAEARGDSEIRQFYSGTTVFLTGGTGFLGKLLIEKLIRSCDIHKIYVLIRERKNKTAQERLRSLLKESVFDELRAKHPNFTEKVIPIKGDVAEIRLGMSESDWCELAEEVNIIFHAAGTTKFNEALKTATLINVRGTRETLHLAQKCKQFNCFVYVSTAYSQATRDRVGTEIIEKIYPSPLPPNSLIELAENMDNARLIASTKNLTDGWPNIYTFTKAVAEELIRVKGGNLPVCIVKPPIVISTYKEPSPGWIDKNAMYGGSGVFLSIIMGFTHVLLNGKDSPKLCIMPADYSTNLTIAAGRDTATRHLDGDKQPKIYIHSSNKTGFTCDHFCRIAKSHDTGTLSTPKSLWYRYFFETRNKIDYWLLTWLLHYIPAYVGDAVADYLHFQRPAGIKSFVKQYTKLYETWLMFSYFALQDWNFSDDNTTELYNRMSKTDKDLFNFDVMTINFDELVTIWGLGIRKHIIKDGLKDTAWGMRKQFWFKIASFIVLPMYAFILFKILYFSVLALLFFCKLFY